jgi:hypothetical protein
VNVTNRYLGVQFLISGETHYGWVRITTKGGPVITGYAYETTPDTSIEDGAVTSPSKVNSLAPADLLFPSSQPGSLGVLARGAEGVAIWRREAEAIAS